MTTPIEAPAPPREERTPIRSAWPEYRFVPVVLLGTIGGVLLATARYGIGLTPDSVVYVSGARSIANGHGFTDNGRAITDFPPGYSAILSGAAHIGIGAIDAARIVAVFGFVATVVLGYLLLRRHCTSPAIRLGATVVVGWSAVLLDVYEKALSEHIFIPVSLLFILVLERQMSRPRSAGLFVASVLCMWAAFYLRYIGLVFVVTGALVLAIAEWRRSRGSALVIAGAYTALGLSAPLAWMWRNTHGGGHALGHRSSTSVSVFTNAARVVKQVATWVVTDAGPGSLRMLLVVILLGLVAAVVWRAYTSPVDRHTAVRPIVPLVLFIAVYVVYLVGSASVVAFGAISNTRFMLPVYVPGVVLGAWGFEQVRGRLDEPSLVRIVNGAAIAFVALNIVWFGARAVNSYRDGAGGYATSRYHNSQILADVRTLDLSIPTFSNDAPAIAILTGRTVQPSVARTFFHSDDQTGKLADFVRLVNCRGDAHLVWLLPNARTYLYTPAQLSRQLSLTPLVKRADGEIYDVRPLGTPTGSCGR